MYPAHENETKHMPVNKDREPFLPLMLATLAAPLVWTLHFAAVYLLEGFLCTPDAPAAALVTPSILAATLVCGGICVWGLITGDGWLPRASARMPESRAFLRAVQRVLAGLSLVAIVWAGAGALFLIPCSFTY